MIAEQIETIVYKEQDILPLLKTLTPAQKKELVPFLKKFRATIFERYEIRKKTKWGISYTTEPKHSETKRDLVNKACYVCFNKTEAKKEFFGVSHLSVSDDYLEHIIPWYTPNWFGDLINEEMPWELQYEKMLLLYDKGLLNPSPALIIARLPNAIVDSKWENEKHISIYKPEVILKHKITLEEHIWLLFEQESNINNYYHYRHIENYSGGNDIWIDTIVNLTQEKKLDRKKVLIATLYTSTKGFNQNLSGWFFDLLLKLNPTIEEVLSLQNEFFAALNSPHSKIVNTVLKYFKTVADHKNFEHAVFIDNASILLNSETKSVVTSALMILEKIAKTHKSSKTSVCKKAAEALITVDEKIQLRAAKIIEKYGDSKKQELLDEVALYAENLFFSSKEVLKAYMATMDENEEDVYETEIVKTLSQENKIPRYETLDDLIFFVSQAIDNNEVYHIDLLLSYLPKLNALLSKENVSKLEPIFKRSLDLSLSFDRTSSQIGYLESEAAYYINDFAEMLMKKFPMELQSFSKTKAQKIAKLKEDRFYGTRYKEHLKEIENQTIPDYIYQIHRFLFVKSKALVTKGLTLELLSTPTHTPCWIDPTVLVERIVAYEKNNEEINLYDFQIAMGRLPLDESPSSLDKQIETIQDNDIIKVFRYQYGLFDIQREPLSKPELWIQSVLSRNKDGEFKYFEDQFYNTLQKEKGTYDWNCTLRNHFYMEYDFKARKQVEKKMLRKELRLIGFENKKTEPESLISSLKSLFSQKKKTVSISSFYKFMHFEKKPYYTTIQPNDDVKFLYLSPNNPSMFLSHVIHNNLKESTFFDESSKKNMINVLKGLYEIWDRKDYKEATYLFVATGFLCSDKVARELAAELWIKANSENRMNNRVLGEVLGKLQLGEYAPLKRFTDLLTTNLFNISKNHNESLYILLDHMIANMGNEPLRGVKKLLELFLELKRSVPNIEPTSLSKEKLAVWKEINTLKSVIKNLE